MRWMVNYNFGRAGIMVGWNDWSDQMFGGDPVI